CHASACRQIPAEPAGGGTDPPDRVPRTWTDRTPATTMASSVQTAMTANGTRQPEPTAAPSGTTMLAPAAPPRVRQSVYAAVTTGTRAAKSRLISPGNATLAIAMPAPRTTVPPNSAQAEPDARTRPPTRISARLPVSTSSSPYRRRRVGATNAKTP